MNIGGAPLPDNTKRGFLSRYRGGIYVTQHLNHDIEYLYRVECRPSKWAIHIYTPKYDANHDSVSFEEVGKQG